MTSPKLCRSWATAGGFLFANNRRHMTAAQRAMAVAMIYPDPEKGGRGKKKTVEATSTLFSAKRLQMARAVLR
jgi:hypothetical protein